MMQNCDDGWWLIFRGAEHFCHMSLENIASQCLPNTVDDDWVDIDDEIPDVGDELQVDNDSQERVFLKEPQTEPDPATSKTGRSRTDRASEFR